MVTTEHARHFYNPEEVSVKIYGDKDEWEAGRLIPYYIIAQLHVFNA